MIEKISDLILQQKLSKLNRRKAVSNLNTAKTAGIIYDAANAENELLIKELCSFLEKENIKTESIGIYLLKNSDNMPMHSLQHFYINRKELNMLKIPKSETVKKFIQKEFDLLFDCNISKQFTLKYISSLSMAKFKIGPAGGYHQNMCDMLIDVKEEAGLQTFIEQAKHYLKIINNN